MEKSPIQNLEDAAAEALQSLNESCKECRTQCAERIRNAPLESVGIALGVGFLFRWIPVGALLTGVLRLLIFSIKPLMLLFGLAKLVELLKSKPQPQTTPRREKQAA